jgi:hypothetical protein
MLLHLKYIYERRFENELGFVFEWYSYHLFFGEYLLLMIPNMMLKIWKRKKIKNYLYSKNPLN